MVLDRTGSLHVPEFVRSVPARPRHGWRSGARAALLALALPGLLACDLVGVGLHEQATDTWTRSYSLPPGSRVEIANVNGRIEATPGGDTVEVIAERVAHGASAEAARQMLDRIVIHEEAAPDRVRIETRLPSSSGFFSGRGEVRYTIRLPAGVHVRLETVNGGIEVDGLKGPAQLEATNGGIVGRNLEGPVEATTTNGGIQIDLARIAPEGVELKCTNGGIRLGVPRDARADLVARITNGGIDVQDLSVEVTGEQSRRRFDGRLNGGGPRVRIEGTNGGIRVRGL